ncbi:MAG: hypothetical protein ACOX6D_08645 [Thermoguttaceae bacterium]|jgi:hypothetical protein
MQFITKTNWMIIFVVLAVGVLAVGTASSVSSCCGRPDPVPIIQPFTYAVPAPMTVATVAEPFVISEPVVTSYNTYVRPVTISAPIVAARPVYNNYTVQRPAFKVVRETEIREEEITTYETVWDEETRYRTRTVCKRVPETTVRRETVRVSKPVWETIEKETSYDVVRYVSETSEREEVKTIRKPVTEYQEREIVETVNRPVQETVMERRCRQVNRPVTTTETRTRDCGEYETRYVQKPARTYTRLTWQRGGEYYDPETGRTRNRLPGLYWTDLSAEPEYKAERVYTPRLVTETVPVTRMVPETIVEEVPVTVNKMISEQVVRTERVPVTRMVEEQVVNKIPVTTYKPVTEKVVKKTPVRVCRMETVDEVRETPVTTYKMVTETIQEPYTVKVARQVPRIQKVQRPVTVCRRVPIDACAPVTVSSPEMNIVETTNRNPAEETKTEESSATTDTVQEFNGTTSTLNYPSDSETITTDAEPLQLPAVPHETPKSEVSNDAADRVPTIVTPSAADQAPPMLEADEVPMLNDTATPAKEPATEPKTEPQTQTLPGIKRAESDTPVSVTTARPIESVLVPRPEPALPEAETAKTAMNDVTESADEYFRFVGSERADSQKRDIPAVSPTRLLPF